MSHEDIITSGQAAELAGVAPATFRKYVSEGRAPAPIVPGRGLYRRSDIERWVKQRPGQGARTDLRGTSAER